MKTSRLLLMTGLAGLFLFSCNEELDIKPNMREDASLQGASTGSISANGRIATNAASNTDVIDFERYPKGTILSEVYGASGSGPVKVYGHNPKFPDRNAVMIFDSSSPTGGDPDLGTPHRDFGGPGIGTGGARGSTYENNTPLGKVLIITEDFDSNDPDDADLRDAYFSFDFTALNNVTVYSMNIMDVEATENTATVTFYNSEGTAIGSPYGLPKVGDNGVYNYFFGTGVSGVVKMVVDLNGSGAIDNIVFSSEEELPPPPPGTGCTATPGYWKNHTKYSAARRDATWDKIGPQGEDTKFFLSGKTYLQVLNTSPKGNAYFILSFQYIAAKLNVLKGASYPAEVMGAIKESEKLFSKYTPAQIAALKGGDPLRQTFLKYASLLDNYNNGRIGPGHCR